MGMLLLRMLTFRFRMLPLTVLLLCCTLLAGSAAAQSLQQLRDQLDRGLYSSAARVTGPALLEQFPADQQVRYLYSLALYLTGNSEEASRQFELLPATTSEVPEADYLHLSGLLRAARGDPAGALPDLTRAYSLSRTYRHAMDWARTAWQAQDYETALQAYLLAAGTERGSREPWPFLDQGRLLITLGRYEEAVTALERAIQVFEEGDTDDSRPSPAYVEAFYRLGIAHQRRGEQEGSAEFLSLAENNYRAALSADPDYQPAASALAALSGE